jgi:hypothetical protein
VQGPRVTLVVFCCDFEPASSDAAARAIDELADRIACEPFRQTVLSLPAWRAP